jgi:hypothetical protein
MVRLLVDDIDLQQFLKTICKDFFSFALAMAENCRISPRKPPLFQCDVCWRTVIHPYLYGKVLQTFCEHHKSEKGRKQREMLLEEGKRLWPGSGWREEFRKRWIEARYEYRWANGTMGKEWKEDPDFVKNEKEALRLDPVEGSSHRWWTAMAGPDTVIVCKKVFDTMWSEILAHRRHRRKTPGPKDLNAFASAIKDVEAGVSISKAARDHNVSKTTLWNRCRKSAPMCSADTQETPQLRTPLTPP